MELNQMISTATRLSGLSCPKCASTSFCKHGKDNNIQRYRCKTCGKTFKETINTPLHWIHRKEKMSLYVWTMHNRQSIRSAAITVEISTSTSFSWRHKLLSSLSAAGTVSDRAPAGICEIRLLLSNKGKTNAINTPKPDTRTVLVADARGIPCLQLLQTRNKVNEISDVLAHNLHPDSEIAGQKNNLLTRASRKTGISEIKHRSSRKSITAQVEKTAGQLEGWMERFHGVATKYLQQYWDWYRIETNTGNFERFESECFGQRQLLTYRMLRSA